MTLISDFILTIPYLVTPVIVPKSWKTLSIPHRQAIPLRTFSLRLERRPCRLSSDLSVNPSGTRGLIIWALQRPHVFDWASVALD
jgi:hypothetical protein